MKTIFRAQTQIVSFRISSQNKQNLLKYCKINNITLTTLLNGIVNVFIYDHSPQSNQILTNKPTNQRRRVNVHEVAV